MAVISQKLFNVIMLSGTPPPLFRITLLRNVSRSIIPALDSEKTGLLSVKCASLPPSS